MASGFDRQYLKRNYFENPSEEECDLLLNVSGEEKEEESLISQINSFLEDSKFVL